MPRLQTQPAPSLDAEAGAARLRAKEAKAQKRVNTLKTRAARALKTAARIEQTLPVRSTRPDTDTTDHRVGQDRPRIMKSTGPAKESLEPMLIEGVERPISKEKIEALAFNEEILTILVHDSTNPTDEPIPYVINGGKRQAFFRGQEQQVRRKYVEVLARMKQTGYSQQKYKDSQDIDSIRQIPHTALKYPFTVIHDPNPRGRDWLKAILAEGA